MSARVLSAALLIGTACTWYAILKPELKIRPDESASLRRRIEAAIAPGREYINSPVLVRTGNKHYLLTIQESNRVTEAYKAELADYLKHLAKEESRAQLDVVYAKSPTLLVKSAVSTLFNSSSAPIFLGILFLALVRLFHAPILAFASRTGPFVSKAKAQVSIVHAALREKQKARAAKRAEALERAHAQYILDLELADLQAEADRAFAAQAATAETQRLAYEALQATELARQARVTQEKEALQLAAQLAEQAASQAAEQAAHAAAQIQAQAEMDRVAAESTSFEFAYNAEMLEDAFANEDTTQDQDDFVQVTSVADILAKVPKSGPSVEVTLAAPTETEAAFTPSVAGGLTFIEEMPEEEKLTKTPRRSVLKPLLETYGRIADAYARRRDRVQVAKLNAKLMAAPSPLNEDLRLEVNRLTSQLNGAKNAWLETATRLQEMKMKAVDVPPSKPSIVTEVSLDLAKLDFVETEVPTPKVSSNDSQSVLHSP